MLRRRDNGFSAKVIQANMAKQGRHVPRLYELCIIRAGALHAGELLLDLWWWMRCVQEFGEKATGEDLARRARVSRSQGFRRLQQLRQMFPDGELDILIRSMIAAVEALGPDLPTGIGEDADDAGTAALAGLEVVLP